MTESTKTTEKAEAQARAWFADHGWQLEPAELRAALEERGASQDLVIELIDEGADRRRAAAKAKPEPASQRQPARNGSTLAPAAGGSVPPQNLDAEEYVLGAMLISPHAIGRSRDVLGDDGKDFYRDSHATIYRAALALHDRGEPVDSITLADELQREGRLDQAGGRVRIHELAAIVPASANVAHYARIVHRQATLRGLIRLGGEAAQLGWEQEGDVDALVDQVRDMVGELEQRVTVQEDTRLQPGGDFILDTPAVSDPVWGEGTESAWAEGEGLVIAGPQGVGKTTLAQQLALASCGLLTRVLGLPVQTSDRRVLYIASDRPKQAARSLRRMVDENSRQDLNDRFLIWAGPLPFLLSEQPRGLARMCERLNVGVVFLDSIKDFVGKPSDEEQANRFNIAVQETLAAGVELCALHHQRKEQQGAGKPKALADVYGNTFLTAGMGSVILLWGDPGDPIVEFKHLKQPNDEVGPMEIRHNHAKGITLREEAPDAYEILRRAGPSGTTAQIVAGMLRQTDSPSKNEIERARRQLLNIVERGLAREEPGHTSQPARFYLHDGRLT